ncbi:hypothetical protein P5V15_002410 [Pogonomyrmex californicus]
MIDVPIDSSCRIVLTDSRNTAMILSVQPETRMERIIKLRFPRDRRSLLKPRAEGVIDGDSSFSDQAELMNEITQVAENDAFPTMNEGDADMRDISRKKRHCDQNAKHCEKLLQIMQKYLMKISEKISAANNEKFLTTDILQCLECRNLSNEHNEDHTPRAKDQYFPHDYAEQNRSSDSGIAVIKLLDDREDKNGPKQVEVNRTEATKIQAVKTSTVMSNLSQDAASQSLKDITAVSDTTATSIDPTGGKPRIYVNETAINNNSSMIDDKQPDGPSPVNSDAIKAENNKSVPDASRVDQHRVTAESKDATTVKTWSFTTESSTRYNIVTGNDGQSTETTIAVKSAGTTETPVTVDLRTQTVITESVTSVPAGYDVTGIDGDTVHPSSRPSSEGHPENRLAVETDESSSMENLGSYEQIKSADNFQTKDDGKAIPAKSGTSHQQLQQTPTTWTVPHPVCFFGNPDQSFKTPVSGVFYPAPFGPSSGQSRGFPFQNHQDSTSPNYKQEQTNTMQFLPKVNYVGNLAQPRGQGIGPTGPGMSNAPISSLNQQPIANMPYFCGYISLPTVHFSSSPDTSDRSADKAKDLPEGSRKLPQENEFITRQSYYPQQLLNKCSAHYRQCDNQFCVLKVKWCDGRVDCSDGSDETKCSCRDRISRNRLCDGYFDCPHGEDELGCFGCPVDSFSCDDWDMRYNRENCIPLLQRCDGIQQCPNGKDELDCNILSESYMDPNDTFTIGYIQGYLHKNVRGQWYPVCSKTFSWAMDACASEIGRPLTMMPFIETVQVPQDVFRDPYVTETNNNDVQVTSCPGTAVYVRCPPLPCGTKVVPRKDFSLGFNTMRNNYVSRRHVEEQSTSEFNKLYRETLGLLDPASQSVLKEKMQNQNDTLVGSQSRVVGGRASQPRAWPFLVTISKDGYFHCGGVILSEVYILTAGHCMDGYEGHYYEIQAGILRRLSFSPMAQLRKAKVIVIHPGYEKNEMRNDIAVITLDKPLFFNRWVRQVCLPALNTAGPEWKEGPSPESMCIAVGWGALKEYGPDPDHLREVEVPILPSCKYLPDQNNATICAGYPEGGRDACQGDSGGPLMCRNPNLESQWYAAGLISHGDGCGRPNEPGVYMKVSYYVDWIQQTFEALDSSTANFYENKPLDSCPGFSCQTGLKNCLPEENHCDGKANCLDGEDEMDCDFLQMNYEGSNDESKGNTFTKSQVDKTSSDTMGRNQVSTETIPSSTSRFSYQTETNENIYATTPEIYLSTPSVRLTFTCKNLIQTITINKRCDRHLDCEDGTDEKDCTCRDYLSNFQPTVICDGLLDCDDKTDEKDCGICKDDEFHCSRSKGCIPMTKKCDAIFDCPLREDEVDCLALIDGDYVNVDSDDRPILNSEGLLGRYYNETWHLDCFQQDILKNNTKSLMLGENLCKYLGFASLQSLDETDITSKDLEMRFLQSDETDYTSSMEYVAASEEGETCSTYIFRCGPVLSSSADSHLVVDPHTQSNTYLWPWLAAIFVDGRYHCSALLLEPDWLLSSSSCTDDIRLSVNYTTALLGRSRSFLYVDGPHQQISAVDEIRDVKNSDVSLLHLKTAVNFTRYVQPLFLEKKIYPPEKDDLCVAVGTDDEYRTQSIFLEPILQDCDKCYRCFVKASGIQCPANETSSSWSGLVFCRGKKAWYPAAVFYESDGPCSFQSTQNLTSIDYIHAYLTQALEMEPQPTPEAACDGIRCNIGQCVPWNQVCDDIPDCRDGADEKSEICLRKVQQIRRRNGLDYKCTKSQLQCKNGECISKGEFCDGKVDCSDGTDEPAICSCAEYLRLTAPERLCDGVRHCFDKTDESPEECQCLETSFICNTDSKENVTCIPQDFVCDGDNDCPNGEDETKCIMVKNLTDTKSDAGEVMQRSYGIWHTRCYPSVITSQEEAASVCQKSGYANGTIDYEYQTFNKSVVPSRDNFYMIRLNIDTWITMRDDKPFITLVQPEEPCYRLFVKCNY